MITIKSNQIFTSLYLSIVAILAFAVPIRAEIYLSNTGWNKPVGTWAPFTQTGTLTCDVTETIVILDDGVTLNGNGRSVKGIDGWKGVEMRGRTSVTIKNLTVSHFGGGIYLVNSSGNTLADNTVNANGLAGIELWNSSSNTLTGNTVSNNLFSGIYVTRGSNNTMTSNIVSGSTYGIYLVESYSYNNLTRNTVNANDRGIVLYLSSGNILTNNTISNNREYGILVHTCSKNQIYNNNFIDNTTQARVIVVEGGYGNSFNRDKPAGGNFWSDWTWLDLKQA